MAFTPNPSLLISAAVLQDYIVDKDLGTPLAAGVVTFYVDDGQRQTLKNWYYQTGIPGNYQYVPGPNPMTLSGVGTFTDAQGNDIIPFFYPFDENSTNVTPARQAYFITVYNANGELQFTRANFPLSGSSEAPVNEVDTFDNLLINGEFWRNIGSVNLPTSTANQPITQINGSNFYYTTLAPSSHDGFSMPDMIALTDALGGSDAISFNQFSGATLQNDLTPEYYIRWNCSSQTMGQNTKCIQFPIQLHIDTLQNQSSTLIFHAVINSGAATIPLAVKILQFTGTGQTNSTFSTVFTFNLNTSWTKYVTPSFLFPTPDSLVPANGTGDDAFYVQFCLPSDTTFDISFAKPQLYLSTDIPNNQWSTYDQIDAIVNNARTGDIRTSLNSFAPFGWVAMNDGTIGNSSSNATARANQDTWPLYNLIWNNVNVAFAPVFTSGGGGSSRGGSAYADWSANKQLQLTLVLGRTLLGLPIPSGTSTNYNTGTGVFTANASFVSLLYVGSPIYLTGAALPSAFTANTVYYVIPVSGTTFKLASTYANALAGTAITGGTAGTPNFTVNAALGGSFGESAHTQLIAEIASHNHATGNGQSFVTSVGATLTGGTGTNALSTVNTTASTGSSLPFNIVQPSVYYNIFMKL
jgi:hypothetical protein